MSFYIIPTPNPKIIVTAAVAASCIISIVKREVDEEQAWYMIKDGESYQCKNFVSRSDLTPAVMGKARTV